MSRSPLFTRLIFLLSLIAFLHILAEIFYFHWTIWWYDVMLHFLAGVSLGIASALLWHRYFNKPLYDKPRIILFTFFFVLLVGVLWEVFELIVKLTSFGDGINYIFDTISDISADLAGGFFGMQYSLKFFEKEMGDTITIDGSK